MDIESYLLGKKAGGGGGTVNLQDKSVTITENTTTNITADSGYDGLNTVAVTTNVGGGINDYLITDITTDVSSKAHMLKKLENITISSSVTSLNYLFQSCINLEEITFSKTNVDTSNITTMNSLFDDCSKLKSLDLSMFDGSSLTKMNRSFRNCFSLKFLDVRKIVFSGLSDTGFMLSSVPTDCEIIVKDTTEKNWFNTNFSAYTNVKTVAEYEA